MPVHPLILSPPIRVHALRSDPADPVDPSLPAREINLKARAPEIRTRNLPVDPGTEPRLLWQTIPVGAHCVSAN